MKRERKPLNAVGAINNKGVVVPPFLFNEACFPEKNGSNMSLVSLGGVLRYGFD